jgi:hypothetical protein
MAARTDGKKEFDRFVKEQSSIEEETIDWDKARDFWLTKLGELYGTIEGELKDYIEGGTITLTRSKISLTEEHIGTYDTEQITIRIGRNTILLKPVGTLLIGTKGRVDVVGPAGTSRFVLVDTSATRPSIMVTVTLPGQQTAPSAKGTSKNPDWSWKIATKPPRIEYIDLNADSLFQVILEVANG